MTHQEIRDAIMRDVCELSPAAQVDDDELIVCTYEQLSQIVTDHLSLLAAPRRETTNDLGGVPPTGVDAAPCSVPAPELSHDDWCRHCGGIRSHTTDCPQHLDAYAPYFCSKKHALVDVAWEGQFRRGTCECGRVLAWSKKGNE